MLVASHSDFGFMKGHDDEASWLGPKTMRTHCHDENLAKLQGMEWNCSKAGISIYIGSIVERIRIVRH